MLLWADRARELNPKAAAVDEDLRKPDSGWAVMSHCCSCVDHFLMLTLRWAGPTHP